nr:hypothetical protein [Bacteroidales bacterium]
CRELPTAWIRGTYDAKDGEMTFASGQYYGKYHFDMFFAGARYPTTNPYWLDEVIFTGADGAYNTSALLMLNGSATEVNPYEFYAGAKLTKIADVAAKPANPTVTYFQPVAAQKDGNYGVICLDIPIVSTEGTNLLTSKLGYQFFLERDGVPTPYTFSKDTYTKLTEDMTVIPYTFADGYDFYLGGTAIFLYADFENATKIGIQTIYTGGNAENKSDIVWYEPSVDGIHETRNGTVHVISETYSDLQGRPVSSSSKGLLLKTVRTSDGTIKTTKVLKK